MPVNRLTLVSRLGAPKEARHWFTSLLQGWGNDAARHNATLLLSEAVTNAVLHARGETIRVAVALFHGHLRAEIHDGSSHLPVRRAPDETGGRGLALFDALSTQWGVVPHPDDGKTVWFEVDDDARQRRPALNA